MINIIILLQMALSLLANPTVQANPAMLAQVNLIVSQVISLSKQEVAKNAEAVNTPIQTNLTTQNLGVATPVVEWVSTDRYMVSNQFALENNSDQRILASSTFQFTISGRLIELKHSVVKEEKCNCNESWFPMANIPLTITYGDQSQTGITDSNGIVKLPFHATGIEGDHRFTYSLPDYPITDYGIIKEQ